jgi:hypothetical protein
MQLYNLVFVFFSLLSLTHAVTPRTRHGLIGYGIMLYQPACAHACDNSISAPLNCSIGRTNDQTTISKKLLMRDDDLQTTSGDEWTVSATPSPECKSTNQNYLETLAYCIKQFCPDKTPMELERFWSDDGPGKAVDSLPAYGEMLASIDRVPDRQVNNSMLLNYTGRVSEYQWKLNYQALRTFTLLEITHQQYGLVVFLSCALIPIGISLLRFLPWPPLLVTKFHGYIVDPPLVGSRHAEPIAGFFIMPTRGQSLFLLYIWGINILLSGIGYDLDLTSVWFPDDRTKVLTFVGNRLGVLCFANIPLVILFAGRNNILLWLTNWSRTTFLLLHRWIAVICMLEAVVHSLFFLLIYSANMSEMPLSAALTKPYWIWGSIGTVCIAVLIIAALQPIRRRAYEIFVAAHIVISILLLVASYQHVVARFGHQRGYETWLYIAIAIWGFDRVARLGHSLQRGLRTAYVTQIDDDYLRLDIFGISATGHVYLHFPSVSYWRIWESHPFSVAGRITDRRFIAGPVSDSDASIYEKEAAVASSRPLPGSREPSGTAVSHIDAPMSATSGVTLLIRKQRGMTAQLQKQTGRIGGVPVIVEGSYNEEVTFLQQNHVRPTHEFPNMVCIAGGVGITGVLPYLSKFDAGMAGPCGSKKLFWGVRSMPLVYAVEDMLNNCQQGRSLAERRWGDVDVSVCVGARLSLKSLLRRHLRQQRGGTVVVVCGPASMTDDVRNIVSAVARHGVEGEAKTLVKLCVENFTW